MTAVRIAEARRILDEADCLADGGTIARALDDLALRLAGDYAGRLPLLLCVMNGGLVFAGQLLTRLRFPLEIDYIHATRYGMATSGDAVQWLARPRIPLRGRDVLLLDDILDVGATLEAIREDCIAAGASSVRTAVLVEKRHERKVVPGLRADFSAMDVPDRFVFGYGMDYRGYWRNAPGIYAVRDA
jgi:hypoxanthine phosphoribosyltransferase